MENIWENDWRPESCMFYFGVQNCIQHTYKSSSNCHVIQDWWETSGKWEKWPKTGIFTYLGTQGGPKIGPLRPIFHTPLKVFTMRIWSNTDVKPVETFWESDQSPEFLHTLGSKMAKKNWAFEAHIVHISESSSNEHIKQDWCESRGNLLTKLSKILIWFIFYTPTSSSNELINQVSYESSGNFPRN